MAACMFGSWACRALNEAIEKSGCSPSSKLTLCRQLRQSLIALFLDGICSM